MNRAIYIVEVYRDDEPICMFETRSVHQACNFLKTINRNLVDVRFFRHNPYFLFNVDDILEVINAKV